MIKVTVTNTTQANELIKAFNGKDYEVEIVVKENTTATNSDVKRRPSRTKIIQNGQLIELD